MTTYLLSTGKTTSRIEYYVLDLFKLYFNIHPGDIPGASDIGFEFNLINVTKDNLVDQVKSSINELIGKISSLFVGITIEISQLNLVNEELVELILNVNGISDSYYIELS